MLKTARTSIFRCIPHPEKLRHLAAEFPRVWKQSTDAENSKNIGVSVHTTPREALKVIFCPEGLEGSFEANIALIFCFLVGA